MKKQFLTLVSVFVLAITSCSKSDDAPTTPAPQAENPIAISSFGPTTGPKNTAVTITGVGFSPNATSNIVTLNGKSCTVLQASSTQLNIVIPPGAGSGNIKVTVNGFSRESNTFTFIDTVTVSDFAGTGVPLFTGGQLLQATFHAPVEIISDASNNFFTIDGGSVKIRKISNDGIVSTLAGAGTGNQEGQGTDASFLFPSNLASDNFGNIFISDSGNHRIRKITSTGLVSAFAGDLNGNDGDVSDLGNLARFDNPMGIAIDNSNNVYVADNNNHKIKKISPTGLVTTFAGSTRGFQDGNGSSARFNFPTSLQFDNSGNLIVIDKTNNRIRKITPNGDVSTLFTILATENNFNTSRPTLAIDSFGTIYFTDVNKHQINKILTSGEIVTVAGLSNGTSGNANGIGTSASFNRPIGLVFDTNGVLYVADTNNHKIRKIVID